MAADSPTFVHQFELGTWDNFIYFLGDKATRRCAVVDPAWDAELILEEARRLDVEISHILCTHSHFDHVNRVDELLEECGVPVHTPGSTTYRIPDAIVTGDTLFVQGCGRCDFVSHRMERKTRGTPLPRP